MSIETQLREEINSEIEVLHKMEMGTEEYERTVNGITKLVDRVIEMEKNDIEHQDRVESREEDNRLRMEQMADERKDRRVKNFISVGGIVIPVAVTIWGTLKSFKFEEEGTITTIMGRGFINKLLPKK